VSTLVGELGALRDVQLFRVLRQALDLLLREVGEDRRDARSATAVMGRRLVASNPESMAFAHNRASVTIAR
jgi:hypothetical protein